MQERREEQTNSIVIIGAGAAGFSAALALANKGYKIDLLEKNTLGSGASGRNPGRMGHGFHYTDIETAKSYLRASVLVQKTYPGYLVGDDLPFTSPLRHGRYFITKDSNPSKEAILSTYEAIKKEYSRLITEDPSNEVFGPPEHFYRILDPVEYQDHVNMDIVDIGIETCEHLFKWHKFASDIKQSIIEHPNITLQEHSEVIDLARNSIDEPRFTVTIKSENGQISLLKTDYIINSTWENIHFLNDKIGIKMIPGERTNRLKALIVLKLPESLHNAPSMFFCMGQHCMISNLGDRAMATFAKVTNMETASGLKISEHSERLIRGELSEDEKTDIAQQMIKGISHYIPQVINAELIDLQFGIVQTKGELALSDLTDPTHAFNKRDDHCVTSSQIGLISNPCMKLFYFIDNGMIVADLVEQQIKATAIIRDCMKLITDRANLERINLNDKIKRVVLENLERYELTSLKEENIKSIVLSIVTALKSRVSILSFLKNNARTIENDQSYEAGSSNP